MRRIAGWSDLWKVTQERREVIDDLYAFHDAFESLRFGQTMLEGLAKDGRLRSHFFTGGTGPNVAYFNDWLPVVQGSLTNVKLDRPLWVCYAGSRMKRRCPCRWTSQKTFSASGRRLPNRPGSRKRC